MTLSVLPAVVAETIEQGVDGARRRGLSRRALVFLPLWLLMLSVASWRAFFELWLRPFHWEKTEHGLTQRGEADAGDQCNFSG